MIGVIALIFAAGRMVGLPRPQAAFAAGVFALLPIPLIQAATTQNDLLLTFFLMAALVFAVTGLRRRARAPLVLAGLAAGLAVGTKLDFVFIAPAALLVLGASVRRDRPPARLVGFGAAAAVLAALALGSFVYVQNELNTHTLSGFSGTPNGDFIKANPLRDAARTAWNMVEAPDLPVPDWVSDPAESVVRPLFRGLHGSYFAAPNPAISNVASADSSAYGLVGLLVLLPLLGISIASPRARPWQRLLALGAVSYFAAYSLALGYNPESGRYLLPAVALAAPLFGLLARRPAGALVTVALLVATLPGAVLHETYKPVLPTGGMPAILSLDRLGQQAVEDDTLLVPLRRLAARVDPHEALGFIGQDDLNDYLLFGQPLARRLVDLGDPAGVTRRLLRARHLRHVFVAFADESPCRGRVCLTHHAGLRFTPLGGSAYLVSVR
jgi:4-amino-4-deoxy-L-arabinose transferase-like glycosyltransferase